MTSTCSCSGVFTISYRIAYHRQSDWACFFSAANVINIQDASPCISQIPERFIHIEDSHEQFIEIHEDINLYLFTDENTLALIDESEVLNSYPGGNTLLSRRSKHRFKNVSSPRTPSLPLNADRLQCAYGRYKGTSTVYKQPAVEEEVQKGSVIA
jgi:hypothetical protein